MMFQLRELGMQEAAGPTQTGLTYSGIHDEVLIARQSAEAGVERR